MNTIALFRTMRIPFLVLTPVCVFLGASTVIAGQTEVNLYMLGLVLTGALLAHISVNTLNEYLDFKSGLDSITTRTPFSGGSGALPAHPEMAGTVIAVGIASLLATIMLGLFFAWKYGFGILPLGVAGVALIVFYTGWINKSPFLCLLAPGAGFGFFMVAGTQYVLEGHYNPASWLIAAVPFFLVNNLLLLNQYPDIQADASTGRNHFPIAYGIQASNRVYATFVIATAAAVLFCILTGYLPETSLAALLPLPLAFFALDGAMKYGKDIGHHPQYLAANTAVAILTPLLLGITVVIT